MKLTAGLLAALLTGISLALTACGGGATSENPLADTSWELKEYADPSHAEGLTPVLTAAVPTLEFAQDGAVHGSGGCNNFHGTYAVSGDAISFGPLATTMMYCEQEGIMNQESAFLSRLESAASFSIDGGELHVLNEAGSLIALFSPH
ncbi:MAG: META domain-containing protein [Longimicrobiales bacterium]